MNLDALAPVTEYVAPAPVICDEAAPVIEIVSSAPVIEYMAPASAQSTVTSFLHHDNRDY